MSEELGPWVPPQEADLLDGPTRAYLDALIKDLAHAMANPSEQDDSEPDLIELDPFRETNLGWLRKARQQLQEDS